MFASQSCPILCDPDSYRPLVDCIPPGSSVHGIPGENTGMGCHSFLLGDLPDPGIEPVSPTFQAYSIPSEPPETVFNSS